MIRKIFTLSILIMGLFLKAAGKDLSLSEKMAATAMAIWKDSLATADGKPVKWSYDQAVVLKGIAGVWHKTGDGKYFAYMQQCMDRFVDNDGNIHTYKQDDYNIDNVLCGRILLTLFKVTGEEKYYKAAKKLREQLSSQPRTKEGGFWHKKRYPNQMWLDGLYMGEPFYAEWSAYFKGDSSFTDIAHQFIWMEQHARDAKSGLLYHGWDESKTERWADKTTGLSPNIWARAMGWYGMALVDALPCFPDSHEGKKELIAILNRYAAAVQKAQDPKSGLWWDIMNSPGKKGNYFEASASSMFVYTMAKGVRMGYLPASYLPVAKKGYDGIVKSFIETDESGQTNLKGTVSVSGLGGTPYRDGSFEYYTGEKVVVNDPKGVGAFILAAGEMELLPTLSLGKGKKVMLDCWFNNEYQTDKAGVVRPHHYLWSEGNNGGYSMFGHVFNNYGVETKMTHDRPSKDRLAENDIYIVIDPDYPKENKNPHYVEAEDVTVLYDWVKQGGVLLLMGNDTGNMEYDHFNTLTEKFGIHFNKDSRNRVTGHDYPVGTFNIEGGNTILKTAKKIYLKEICTLKLEQPAKAVLTDKGDVIMAVAKVGRGTVFAVGDPWLYNEYLDGRKLPVEFDNYKAANDLVRWVIAQTNKVTKRK